MCGSYPQQLLEVFVVDGGSTDNTVQVVEDLINEHNWNIRIIDNPEKVQSWAINYGIAAASGEFIARADAHSEYQPDYLEKLAGYMAVHPEVWNVGGLWDVRASRDTDIARAIATAYSHQFSTGRALYRIGVSEPTYVDTVPFGFFRREVFEKIGNYDIDLLRNEDQEFNHRIIAAGGKILLVPDVETVYYARPDIISMARMFFQYGWFKPLSQVKQKKVYAYRQFAPMVFLLIIVMLVVFAALAQSKAPEYTILITIAVYVVAGLTCAVDAARKKRQSLRLVPSIALVFLVTHVSFLAGNIKGIWDFVIMKKKHSDAPLTR